MRELLEQFITQMVLIRNNIYYHEGHEGHEGHEDIEGKKNKFSDIFKFFMVKIYDIAWNQYPTQIQDKSVN